MATNINKSLVAVAAADPYLTPQSTTVQEGEFVILVFADKRQIFAQALKSQRGKSPALKINKRAYSTSILVGRQFIHPKFQCFLQGFMHSLPVLFHHSSSN